MSKPVITLLNPYFNPLENGMETIMSQMVTNKQFNNLKKITYESTKILRNLSDTIKKTVWEPWKF